MKKPLIVVTGKTGQVGFELLQLAANYAGAFDFLFTDRTIIDLNIHRSIDTFFQNYHPTYFINCAAYTLVDKAEEEHEKAMRINSEAVGLIARHCANVDATFIQISTDYVFDGEAKKPYPTDFSTNPINFYGQTKLSGERLIQHFAKKYIIIRTSWVYSTHGNNFVKTMQKLMNEKTELNIVNDQIGSPTYAADLATAILQIITALENRHTHYGIYHYSNNGMISWYDFACAIRDSIQSKCKLHAVPTSAFPTKAKRPAYAVLNKKTITKNFGITLQPWKKSLKTCLQLLNVKQPIQPS